MDLLYFLICGKCKGCNCQNIQDVFMESDDGNDDKIGEILTTIASLNDEFTWMFTKTKLF